MDSREGGIDGERQRNLEIRGALFDEGLDALGGVAGSEDVLDESHLLDGGAVADGKVAALVRYLLDPAEAGAALAAQGGYQLFQLIVDLLQRGGTQGQTPLDGLGSVEPATGGEQLHGALRADEAGQAYGGAAAGHEPEVDVLVADASVIGHEAMSQAIISSSPPARAKPWTTAITGMGMSSTWKMTSLMSRR